MHDVHLESRVIRYDPGADAHGTLVHVEVRPHPVAGAVLVVQAGGPQVRASEGVQAVAGDALGVHQGAKSHMA